MKRESFYEASIPPKTPTDNPAAPAFPPQGNRTPQAQTPQTLPDTKELAAYTQVELNTADADALCTLPGVGPHNAQAILDYRAQHGPFAQVEDAAQVPGITQAMVDSWAGQAYVR